MLLTRFVPHFRDLKDPRVPRAQRHSLMEILVTALLATLAGADGWEDMEDFARSRITWLQERVGLVLANGAPSDDTFRRVFAALEPEEFQRCFQVFVQELSQATGGKVVCVDGKTVRHSFDTACGQKPVHIVRAWASENRLVLGALPTEAKSNEIPAVRALLALLDLKGALVTADAEHTQKETAAQIRKQGGDYLLSLKKNQPHLYEDVCLRFENLAVHPAAVREWQQQVPGRHASTCLEVDFGHGRRERRLTTVLRLAPDDPEWKDIMAEWADLRCLVRVERLRESASKPKQPATQETAYYLCSRCIEAKPAGRYIRGHWSIENSLHYVLDISFLEDNSRVRLGNSPQNLAALRDIAINLLQKNTTSKRSIKGRRKSAAWNSDYLLELIA